MTAPMRIRITKSDSLARWYHNRIGDEFDVIGIDPDGDYIVNGEKSYVEPSDCESVDPAPAPAGEGETDDAATVAAEKIMESVQDLSEADYKTELNSLASIIRATYAPVQAKADVLAIENANLKEQIDILESNASAQDEENDDTVTEMHAYLVELSEAMRKECKKFNFPDEDRLILWEALCKYDARYNADEKEY